VGIGFLRPLDPLPPLFSLSCTSFIAATRAVVPFRRPDESELWSPLGVIAATDDNVVLRRMVVVDVGYDGERVPRLYESCRRMPPDMGGEESRLPAVRGRLLVVRLIFSSASRIRSSRDVPTGDLTGAISRSSSMVSPLLLLP
jgi:hypothetical protein